MQLLHECLSYY